jgi:hypothetical protein
MATIMTLFPLQIVCSTYIWGPISLEEKPHFSTCLKRLKMSFVTIFDKKIGFKV